MKPDSPAPYTGLTAASASSTHTRAIVELTANTTREECHPHAAARISGHATPWCDG
jgi:hypothetical protein